MPPLHNIRSDYPVLSTPGRAIEIECSYSSPLKSNIRGLSCYNINYLVANLSGFNLICAA